MTSFDLLVLGILSRSGEAFGWYQIERRLSTVQTSERPHLPSVLTRLVEKGLVVEMQFAVEPLQRYRITESGQHALERTDER